MHMRRRRGIAMRIHSALNAFATTLFASGMLMAAPVPQAASHSDAASQSTTPHKTVTDQTRETRDKTTKEHTVTVVGKVKSYKAGDSLTVTTPKGRAESFDLNARNTTVSGAENIRAGEMVRVTKSDENGKTMIKIEPYSRATSANTDNSGAAPARHHKAKSSTENQ
jgi:hypothetical protein